MNLTLISRHCYQCGSWYW